MGNPVGPCSPRQWFHSCGGKKRLPMVESMVPKSTGASLAKKNKSVDLSSENDSIDSITSCILLETSLPTETCLKQIFGAAKTASMFQLIVQILNLG